MPEVIESQGRAVWAEAAGLLREAEPIPSEPEPPRPRLQPIEVCRSCSEVSF